MSQTSILTSDIADKWLDAACQYAIDVRDGKREECRYVRLAVDRWFYDLETGHERGIYFDERAAAKFFRFVYHYCRHYIGEFAGKPLELEPWQCFIEANIHGWLREDGRRRFKIVHEEVPRKQGKSTRLSACGNYYLIADDEPGAQVYIAASKRDQTKEIFDAAANMIRNSPKLSKLATAYRNEIRSKESIMLRLSKDYKKMDGFNTHAGLLDELHAHKDSGIWDVIRSSMGSRRQPILRAITTAGFDRKSFAFSRREYLIKVLERTIEDDSIFGIIYTIDDPEKWDDENEWRKANPNLGISTSLDDMREQYREACEMPTAKVEFLTKRLNVWTYAASQWMRMAEFEKCQDSTLPACAIFGEDETDFDGQECWGGLDLASTEDLCSLSICFPGEGGKRTVFQRSYLPSAAMERRLKDGDKTLEKFRENGTLIVLDGYTVDYNFIKKDLLYLCNKFDVRGIAFDRFNASQLVNDVITEGVPMVKFGQGHYSMNAPMKELMRLVLCQQFQHNDPLLAWAMSNVVATINPAGDIKPDKSKCSEKIDPAVATIMAIGLAMTNEEKEPESLYNDGKMNEA